MRLYKPNSRPRGGAVFCSILMFYTQVAAHKARSAATADPPTFIAELSGLLSTISTSMRPDNPLGASCTSATGRSNACLASQVRYPSALLYQVMILQPTESQAAKQSQ